MSVTAAAGPRRWDPWLPMRFARSVHLEASQVPGAQASVQLQRTVLLIIASYADPDGGHANPSVPTIAADAGVNERTARRALRALEAAGLVRTRTGDPRGQRSNRYQLVLPPRAGEGPALHAVGDVEHDPSDRPRRRPRPGSGSVREVGGVPPAWGHHAPRPAPVPKNPPYPPSRPQAGDGAGTPDEPGGPAAPGSPPPPATPAGGSPRPARRTGCDRHPRRAVPGCPACGNRDPLPPDRRARSSPQRADPARIVAELRSERGWDRGTPHRRRGGGRPSGQPPGRGQDGSR